MGCIVSGAPQPGATPRGWTPLRRAEAGALRRWSIRGRAMQEHCGRWVHLRGVEPHVLCGGSRLMARWDAMRGRAAVIYTQDYWCNIGPHVFPMEKFGRLRDRLVSEDVTQAEEILVPEPATREQLLLAHSSEYLDDLEQLRWTPRTMWSELPLEKDIVRAYVLAAGGTLLAARESLSRGTAINLSGGFHHAFADRAEGFCYINDLAVAVCVLLHEGRIRRAAIVDCDVHQGNGTARIFENDPRVFTFSIHQELNYPVPKQRSSLDVGLPNGTTDQEYLRLLAEALEQVWAFRPDLVLYQAGADPYGEDQLGGLGLTIGGLEDRDRRVLEGAAERGIPFAVTLGGGYARRLEDTVEIHFRTARLTLRLARELAARPR